MAMLMPPTTIRAAARAASGALMPVRASMADPPAALLEEGTDTTTGETTAIPGSAESPSAPEASSGAVSAAPSGTTGAATIGAEEASGTVRSAAGTDR